MLSADVVLGQVAVLGVSGGDLQGYPEVGACVGGGFGGSFGVDGLELGEGTLLEFFLALGVLTEVGADKHEGSEMGLGGGVLNLVVAVAVESGEQLGVAAIEGEVGGGGETGGGTAGHRAIKGGGAGGGGGGTGGQTAGHTTKGGGARGGGT